MTQPIAAGQWVKSSYSESNGGECVEIAHTSPHTTALRDSKAPHGPVLTFPARGFTAFLLALTGDRLGPHGTRAGARTR